MGKKMKAKEKSRRTFGVGYEPVFAEMPFACALHLFLIKLSILVLLDLVLMYYCFNLRELFNFFFFMLFFIIHLDIFMD